MILSTGQSTTADAIGGRFQLVDTLHVNVASDVTYDRNTGIYHYRYSIRNYARSMVAVESFQLIGLDGPVDSVETPPNWESIGRFPDGTVDKSGLGWFAFGPPPAGWKDDGVSVPPSDFAVQPGDTLSGFAFSSRLPPGQVRFRVRPFEPILELKAEDEFFPDLPAHADGDALGPDSTARP